MSFDLAINNGDFTLTNGDLTTITGTTKLEQDLLKIALTDAGSNILQPWYGSLLGRTLIGTSLSNDITVSQAQQQLQNCVQNLKNLQNLQVQSGQKVQPDEQIAFISDISIVRSAVDLRLFSVVIRVLSRSFGQVTTQFTLNST